MRRAPTRSQRGELALAGLSDLGLLPRELTSGLAAVTGSRVAPESCRTVIAVTLSQHARAAVERRCGVFEELSIDLSLSTADEQREALRRRCTSSTEQAAPTLEAGGHPWALVAALVAEDLVVAASGDEDARELARGLSDLCRVADSGPPR
jgi:hypothetical protein